MTKELPTLNEFYTEFKNEQEELRQLQMKLRRNEEKNVYEVDENEEWVDTKIPISAETFEQAVEENAIRAKYGWSINSAIAEVNCYYEGPTKELYKKVLMSPYKKRD